MADGHQHSHDAVSPARLGTAAAFNVGFAVVQVVVGLAIGSVVVLADAAHQVVDAAGLLTALGAALLLRRPATAQMTFGWGKADALGGFVSGLLLLASVVYLAYESTVRLWNPVEVDGLNVVVIGLIAIAVNGISIWLLSHNHGGHQLSIAAARLHLITDLAGSFLVVMAGLILSGTDWLWIDPVASLVLCAAVLASNWNLLRRTTNELLDRTPTGLSVDDVRDALTATGDVTQVHHVHVRPLGQGRSSVTAHVVVEGDLTVHEAQEQTSAFTKVLERELGISHATIQLECHPCQDEDC